MEGRAAEEGSFFGMLYYSEMCLSCFCCCVSNVCGCFSLGALSFDGRNVFLKFAARWQPFGVPMFSCWCLLFCPAQ